MPRWITVRTPFDYRWPDRSAITAYTDAGEFFVKDEVADYAVDKGFATEGKADGSEARSVKGKGTRKPKAAKPEPDAAAADNGSDAGMAGPDLAEADSAEVRSAVDPDAE